MGKHRIARSARRGVLVAAVVALGLMAFTPGANAAPEPQEIRVTPVILHACPSGANLVTAWGYNNSTAGTVHISAPDSDDDPRATFGDGDNDDNFFVPAPDSRGQVLDFLTGAHDSVTTSEPAPTTWVLGANVVTSSAPVNCADLAVTKTQAIDTVTTGSLQQYTISVKNNGPTDANSVSVTDTFTSTAASGVTATPSQGGACTVSLPTITCSAIGTIANQSTVTIAISLTPTGSGSIGDTATATSTTFDPSVPNTASVTTTLGVPGGPSGGGILNTGQQLTFADPAVKGTVKVTTGTVALTASVGPCPAVTTVTCKSEAFNVQPHSNPTGQILTAVFDTGRPSPFVLIPFVKFFYFKDDNIDHPLPFCPHYLKPIPPANGTPCEYFRWMDLHGHAIVYVAFGAQDPRTHR